MDTITEYNENYSEDDAKTGEKHTDEEVDDKDNKDDHSRSKPASDTNLARCTNHIWLDLHNIIPRIDPGLFIPGIPTDSYDVDGDFVIDTKQSHPRDEEGLVDTPGPSKARRSSKKQLFARDCNGESNTDPFKGRRPDLVLVDHSTQEPRQDRCLCRHFAVLLEVKRTRSDGPNTADGTTLTALAAQLADMARLHLAARSFMRYSVHLTVGGSTFNLAIFESAGGVVSKDYNINKDTEVFIRIIRRLRRDLDAYDLGLNRTVVPLRSLGSWKQYPEFRVKVGESTYITQGLPPWQSTSLFGRRTFVWVVPLETDVNESDEGRVKTFILKNAWQVCARWAESSIYKMMYSTKTESASDLTDLDGVARFVDGGDIFDPQQPNEVINMSSHHRGFGKPINENDDPVLHRLVLASHGRKVYEFVSFSQLMRAAKEMNKGTLSIFAQHSFLTLFQDFVLCTSVVLFMVISVSVICSWVRQRRSLALSVTSTQLKRT